VIGLLYFSLSVLPPRASMPGGQRVLDTLGKSLALMILEMILA